MGRPRFAALLRDSQIFILKVALVGFIRSVLLVLGSQLCRSGVLGCATVHLLALPTVSLWLGLFLAELWDRWQGPKIVFSDLVHCLEFRSVLSVGWIVLAGVWLNSAVGLVSMWPSSSQRREPESSRPVDPWKLVV